MTPLRTPTAPAPRPKVDPITHKEAWGFLLKSLDAVESVSGNRPIIARSSFQEHPKKPGDFNEFVELDVGGATTQINLKFICDMGLYLEVLDCDPHKKPKRVLDECLTDLASYRNFLGFRLVESICRQALV